MAPSYPFEDFLKDFDLVHAAGELKEQEFVGNVQAVDLFLKYRYDDAMERRYRMGRFMLILMYVSEHIHDLDSGDFAVFGSEKTGALVSEHVLRAVHSLYTGPELPNASPKPSEVLALASEFRTASER